MFVTRINVHKNECKEQESSETNETWGRAKAFSESPGSLLVSMLLIYTIAQFRIQITNPLYMFYVWVEPVQIRTLPQLRITPSTTIPPQ